MSVVDQFDTEGYLCDEPLLEYIRDMALFHFPDVDFDENGNAEYLSSLGVLYTFAKRHNKNEINYNFKFENYLKNKDIQDTIKALNIDSEKFWFMLLFIYDLSYCKCVDGYVTSESASDQIIKFLNAVCLNVIDVNASTKKMFKEPATLTLKIGKKKVVIDNPIALLYLASNSADVEKDSSVNSRLNWSMVDFDNKNIKTESNSIWICYFYKMMKVFLDDCNKKRPKQKKGDTISLSMLLFISRLIYFTGITKSKSYLTDPNKPEDGVDGSEQLKQCLKEYKNKEIKTTDLVYMAHFK
jgi:hypothetical protein